MPPNINATPNTTGSTPLAIAVRVDHAQHERRDRKREQRKRRRVAPVQSRRRATARQRAQESLRAVARHWSQPLAEVDCSETVAMMQPSSECADISRTVLATNIAGASIRATTPHRSSQAGSRSGDARHLICSPPPGDPETTNYPHLPPLCHRRLPRFFVRESHTRPSEPGQQRPVERQRRPQLLGRTGNEPALRLEPAQIRASR